MGFKAFAALVLALALVSCQAPTPAEHSEEPDLAEMQDPAPKPREFILPAAVVPQSDSLPDFGIDVSALSEREAAVVKSAWHNYQRVLAGKEPDCSATYGLSDGGSTMYDCGTYEIMRIKSLPDRPGKPGYDYGPSLDFLNGHKVERLRFVTYEELERLENAP